MEEKMEEKFEQWAVVELFGHSRIAGKISEMTIGGCSFVRVDVPANDGRPAFSKIFGQGAIYSMLFVDEETAMGAVAMLPEQPVCAFSARSMIEGIEKSQMHTGGELPL